MNWIIDLLIVGVILFFAWRGLRKGLIMAVAGAVTMLVAVVGAYFAANMFSHHMEGFIEAPVRSWVANRMENMGDTVIGERIPTVDSHALDALRDIGFNENLIPFISNAISGQLQRVGYSFQEAIAAVLVTAVSHILTYIIAFIVLLIALKFAARLLDTIAKLPVLNTANKLGGLLGGLVQGVAIVWVSVYVLRFVGAIGEGTVEGTFLLRFFGG
jgi:uncharacterized membrane protein required for colicin V production